MNEDVAYGYLATVDGFEIYVKHPTSIHDRDNLLKTLGLPPVEKVRPSRHQIHQTVDGRIAVVSRFFCGIRTQ